MGPAPPPPNPARSPTTGTSRRSTQASPPLLRLREGWKTQAVVARPETGGGRRTWTWRGDVVVVAAAAAVAVAVVAVVF